MSAADGLVRNEEVAGATPATLTIWKAGRYKLAAPVLKTGSASPRSEHYRRLPPANLTINQRNPMKPVIRYQSQLLFRKSYKPNRVIRIRPGVKLNFSFQPVRFGLKP